VHAAQGRGLGLAIAKQLVKRYGGTLGNHSEPERGTTVSLMLLAAVMTPVGVAPRCREW